MLPSATAAPAPPVETVTVAVKLFYRLRGLLYMVGAFAGTGLLDFLLFRVLGS